MKIICIGRNYAEHAQELGNEIPESPVIFMKPDTAVLKKGSDFYIPEFSNDIHYELELVLRVSKYFTLRVGDLIFTGTPKGVGKVAENDVLEAYLEDQKVFKLRIQ